MSKIRGRLALTAAFILTGFTLTAGVAARVGLGSHPGPPADPADPPHRFTFDFPPTQVDEEHPSLVCRLPVTNPTGRPVRIVDVQTTCGCTKAELSARELPPGAGATLVVEVNLRGRDGPFQNTTRLVTDDPSSPAWEYEVRTVALPRAQFAPRTLFVGLVETGESRTAEAAVLLTVPAGAEFPRLESVTASSPAVTVEPQPATTEEVAGGRRMRVPLRLAVRGGELTGAEGATVTATCAWPGGRTAESLPLNWTVQGPLSVSPSGVFFGSAGSAAGPVTRQVLVRRADGRPLRLSNLSSDHPAVSCRVASEAADRWVLEVKLDPDRLDGPVVGRIQAETDHPRQPRLRVEFSALK